MAGTSEHCGAFRANVRSHEYPSDEESYHLPNGTKASLEPQLANPPTRYSSCQVWIILIFVLAILFTYLIDPLMKFLQRHSLFFRNLRGPAVVEVYLAFVILIALAGYSFAPNPSEKYSEGAG